MKSAEEVGRPLTVLVIDAAPPGWQPGVDQVFSTFATQLKQPGIHPILSVVVPGLGGIWTDVVDDLEILRFGYPDPPGNRDFDPFDPSPRPQNLFVRHWERVVYGRTVRVVFTLTPRVVGPLHSAIAGQDVLWWGKVDRWKDWTPILRRKPSQGQRVLPYPTLLFVSPEAGPPPSLPRAIEVQEASDDTLPRVVTQRLEQLT